MHMVRYRRNQDLLMQVPQSVPSEFAPEVAKVRALVRAALAAGRTWLTEPEAKAVLEAYQIPTVPTHSAATPAEARKLAEAIGAPCALKILSPDITHKSDVGGVALGLATPDAVLQAAEAMAARIAQRQPDARVDGFTVQPMIARQGGHELIVGLTEDAQFGPVVLFGHGGLAAELIADTALALVPLNMTLARALMERTRVYRLLLGYRSQPPAALDAIALTLVKVSQLAVDLAEIVELDINPLIVDASGVMALDARIRIRATTQSPETRLAIRPYPNDLEEVLELPGGRRLLLRPIRPEDAPAFVAAFQRLSPEAVRMRFFSAVQCLSLQLLARLTQIDYDREMAFVLCEPGQGTGGGEIFGVARLVADPDNEKAEYAIVLRSEVTGLGLGALLMRRLIDYARAKGIRLIRGDVLRENASMLALCRRLGFAAHSLPEDLSMRVELDLSTGTSARRVAPSAATADSPV
jgi:acetyltransferase